MKRPADPSSVPATGSVRCACFRAFRGGGERASASVEFLALSILVLLPLVYLLASLARVQAGSFAAVTAAREAARTYVAAADDEQGAARAEAALNLTLQDFGVAHGTLSLQCEASPCLTPEASVEAVTTVAVHLPLFPDFLDGVFPTSVTVEGRAVDTVDRFRG